MLAVFEALGDAVFDTLGLVPFLFATYLAMEALEHAGMGVAQRLVTKAGMAGPLVGAVLGVVPQCGFSAMAATLYSVGVLTAGTLVAVVLSTSDEMLPVFVANGEPVGLILHILGLKIVIGLVAGLLVELFLRVWRGPQKLAQPMAIASFCEREGCQCQRLPYAQTSTSGKKESEPQVQTVSGDGSHKNTPKGSRGALEGALSCADCPVGLVGSGGQGNLTLAQAPSFLDAHEPGSAPHPSAVLSSCHEHHLSEGKSAGGSMARSIVWSAFIHTAKVTLFLLIITFGLDLVLNTVGSDVIATFFIEHPSSAVVVAGLVGLIPNCAASVIISELYIEGALGAGALVSGLLVGSGVTPLVLFRADHRPKRDFAIMGTVLAVGLCVGFIVNACGVRF